MEVLQRGEEYSHLFFNFRFYRSGFTRREFRDDEMFFLSFTRHWAWRHLDQNRQSLPLSRWAKPIIVECR
jgi:hypothetical protein